MEQDAQLFSDSVGDDGQVALMSIAISMRRIADVIEGDPSKKLGLVDGVMHAIEQGILEGRR